MKTVLITGGSEGIGKAIATRLAPTHRVIILATNEDTLRQTAQEVGCEYRICDVRDEQKIQETVAEIGAIDCLINNAGLWIEGPLDQNDPERIRQVIDVNVLGVINSTKAVLTGMKARRSGRIVIMNSQAGLYAKPNYSVYNASKWALTGFAKALQSEVAEFDISVTSIHPGKVHTHLFDKAGTPKDLSNALDPDEVAKAIEFTLNLDNTTVIPELGMKHLDA
jgi:NADP-dependent 3-hydroxy acid dehydrogenase YdfG